MFAKVKSLWRAQPLAVLLFLGAAVITLFFAVRLVVFSIYWADPMHRDQEILGWMTPRYVAHSWRVPPEVLQEALGISTPSKRPKSLVEYAKDQGIDFATLKDRLDAAITAARRSIQE